MMRPLDEFRVGRNFIRVGDRVRILKGWSGKRAGFDARVLRIDATDDGTPISVDVIDPRNGNLRVIRVEHVARRAQTKGGETRHQQRTT